MYHHSINLLNRKIISSFPCPVTSCLSGRSVPYVIKPGKRTADNSKKKKTVQQRQATFLGKGVHRVVLQPKGGGGSYLSNIYIDSCNQFSNRYFSRLMLLCLGLRGSKEIRIVLRFAQHDNKPVRMGRKNGFDEQGVVTVGGMGRRLGHRRLRLSMSTGGRVTPIPRGPIHCCCRPIYESHMTVNPIQISTSAERRQ